MINLIKKTAEQNFSNSLTITNINPVNWRARGENLHLSKFNSIRMKIRESQLYMGSKIK